MYNIDLDQMHISSLKLSDLPSLLHNKSTLKTYTSFLKDIDIACGLQTTYVVMNQLDNEHKSYMKSNVMKALKAVAKACVELDPSTMDQIDPSLLNIRPSNSITTMNSKSPTNCDGDNSICNSESNIAEIKKRSDVVLTDVESNEFEDFEGENDVPVKQCEQCVFWKQLMRDCIPFLPEKKKEDLALLFLNKW